MIQIIMNKKNILNHIKDKDYNDFIITIIILVLMILDLFIHYLPQLITMVFYFFVL